MNWKRSKEDTLFLNRIESCEYPIESFNHLAHLRLAYIYLSDSTPSDALASMKTAIQRLLQSHQIDESKYHATLTRAWIFAVLHFMKRVPECPSSSSFLESAPALLDSKIMETHFSPRILFSEKARRSVVYPDRDPIPNYSA